MTQPILSLLAVTLVASTTATSFPSTTELNKYLIVGTGKEDKALKTDNVDLGADAVVLSKSVNDNVGTNLDSVFLENAGRMWINSDGDYLPGASLVHEGVSWTGDVALTSNNAKFNMGNTELYGQVGVVAEASNPPDSVDKAYFFGDGIGNGLSGGGTDLKTTATIGSQDFSGLRAEMVALEDWITNLTPEVTLKRFEFFDDKGFDQWDLVEMNVDQYDLNGDGIAVIDIEMGDQNFQVTNTNWIIESENLKTFAIFRIVGDSNFELHQSSLMVGDGILDNGAKAVREASSKPPALSSELRAIFVKTKDTKKADGSMSTGESTSSSNTVFNFNNAVLNGVGFFDLVSFSESGTGPYYDDGRTSLKVNGGQGCTKFISPRVELGNVRFEGCQMPALGASSSTAQSTAPQGGGGGDRKFQK
jgi:hypothetical protein